MSSSDSDQDAIGNEEVELPTVQKLGSAEAKSNEEQESSLSSPHDPSVDPSNVRLQSFSDSGKGTSDAISSPLISPISPVSSMRSESVFSDPSVTSGPSRPCTSEMVNRTVITKVDTHWEPPQNMGASSSNQPTDNSVAIPIVEPGGSSSHQTGTVPDEAVAQPSSSAGMQGQVVPSSDTKYVRRLRRRPSPAVKEDLNAIVRDPTAASGSGDRHQIPPSRGRSYLPPEKPHLPIENPNAECSPGDDENRSPDFPQLPAAEIGYPTQHLAGESPADDLSKVSWGIFMLIIGAILIFISGFVWTGNQDIVFIAIAIMCVGSVFVGCGLIYLWESINCEEC